jgi:hypothetical protein
LIIKDENEELKDFKNKVEISALNNSFPWPYNLYSSGHNVLLLKKSSFGGLL